ncbi:MAG: hypothetical protein GY856_38425 [bacterium]|nr:hypothetical protein [bacterium]
MTERSRRHEALRGGLLLLSALLLAGSVGADSPTGPCASTVDDTALFSLVYTGNHDVTRPRGDRRVQELSGLAWQSDSGVPSGFRLWLIDDSRRSLFRADVNGHVGADAANKIDLGRTFGDDLEGVLFRREDEALYAIQEGEYRIVRVDLSNGVAQARITGTFPLSEMTGYETVTDPGGVPLATYVSTAASANGGLEGIAYFRDTTAANDGQGSFFVVKEKNPGLLIEINAGMDTVLDFTVLNCGDYPGDTDCESCTCPSPGELPFSNHVDGAARDFSGLSYDSKRKKLWIAGDKSTAVFLYDVDARTYNTFPLFTESFSACIRQVEGVTYLERLDSLHVVSDRHDSAILFRYAIVDGSARRGASGRVEP